MGGEETMLADEAANAAADTAPFISEAVTKSGILLRRRQGV